jgi:uncharacterized protein
MKFKPTLITLISILVLGFAQVKAQTNTGTFTASHLQAAERFLISTGINNQFGAITDNIVQAFGGQMPENNRTAFIDVMQKFMHKYYTWENLKGDMSKIYAAEFSEDELVQMTTFFNTPVGKKYSAKMIILTQKGMALGEQVVKDHQSELEQMIKDAVPNSN